MSSSISDLESDYDSESGDLSNFVVNSDSKADSSPSSISDAESESEHNSEFQAESESESDSNSNLIPDDASESENDSYDNNYYDYEDDYDEKDMNTLNCDSISKIIGINQPSYDPSSSSLMYYVKFKGKSYRHCMWITREQLLQVQNGSTIETSTLNKPNNFIEVSFLDELFPESQYKLYKLENVIFEKDYYIPEKVLSIFNDADKEEYLVKWKSLDISESTWETEDIPNELIDEFKNINSNTHLANFNPKSNRKHLFRQIQENPVFKNGNKLNDFQVEALNWLQNCWCQRRSSILADEMGLGKTIEAISILDCLSKWHKSWGPFLVICPLSTITNWENEFKKWTNFRVVCFIGNKDCRKVIKDNLIYYHDLNHDKISKEKIIFDVLLVSYEIFVHENSFIKKFKFMYTVIDEAQKLKNANNTFYSKCKLIQSYHFLLLTGTPIQNNLFEIWSLLHFIAPTQFPKFDSFEYEYNDQENPETIEKLHEKLEPYIFRRLKNEVDITIPEKEETIIEVEMTQIQRTFSQILFKDNLDILTDRSLRNFSLNNLMLQLRKLLCHPFLFPHIEKICISEYKEKHNISYSTHLTEEQEINALILASGKTILIDKLLPKLKEGNHKVLIFSQFTSVLDILEDYLNFKNYTYERLDGSIKSKERSASIDRFQNEDDVFIFLLSTRAGGLGINLTSADTVIIYDSDWNPQSDIQAQARCHRIGQTKKVNVYRLITRASYESEMFERASKKLALDYAILDSNNSFKNSENKISLNRKELEMILKKGAYYTFNDDQNEIEKFCSENIDQILQNRSHLVKDVVSGGKSKFSKVTFDTQTEDSKINSNEFWEKLIGTQKIIENHDKSNAFSGMRTRHKKRVDYSYVLKKSPKHDKESSDIEYSSDSEPKTEDKKQKKTIYKSNITDSKIFENAISTLKAHGIGASRLFVSDYIQELCRTLVSIIYMQACEKFQESFQSYIQLYIPDVNKQINDSPFKELKNDQQLLTLIKGEEMNIIKCSYNWDMLYRVAVYISNEKLPQNFQFVPEMSTIYGWTAIEDFVALTASPFLDCIPNITTDEKLPFKSLIERFPQSKNWIYDRIALIVKEVSTIIPKDYAIYNSSDYKKPKMFSNIKLFKTKNHHVVYPQKLNRCLQKKLLRIFYLYGIPTKNGIQKINKILNQFIDENLVLIFTFKILIRALKYKPELIVILRSLPNINKIDMKDRVDIRWIKDEAIEAVANNLYLLLKVRESFEWIIETKSFPKVSKAIPEWTEISAQYKWWSATCDIILLRWIAYYGFLLNSVGCLFYSSSRISKEEIVSWRESEIMTLTPIIHPKSEYISMIFPFERREKRLHVILDTIEKIKNDKI